MADPINGRRTKRKPWFTDSQWITISTALTTIIVILSQVLSTHLISRSERNTAEIKKELDLNNNGLGTKLDNIEATGDQTHAIVNGHSVAQDQVVATTTKALAVITKDPNDILTAKIAADKYKKNIEQQEILDAKAFPQEEKEKQP